MSYYGEEWKFTHHAIQRFIERSHGDMNLFQARIEMVRLLNNSFRVEISDNEIHYEVPSENMIFVSVDGLIVTFK